MANISVPNTFSPNTLEKSADMNANFNEIQTKYNTGAVQTDVAKTITASHTFSAPQTFSGGLTGNVTGNVTGNCSGSAGSAPASALTGNTLAAGVTASSLTSVGVLASPHMTTPTVDSGDFTLAAGVTLLASGLYVVQTADLTIANGTTQNTNLAITLGANQKWRIDFDIAASVNGPGGLTFVFSAPAGATGRANFFGPTSSASAFFSGSTTNLAVGPVQFSTYDSSSAPIYVRASVYVATAGTGGAFTLQLAANGTYTTKVYAGSSAVATRLA